ncbi:hypothetical protein ABIE56_003906 [Luteibacter sp. 621]|jgi:hypothetical protein|uniref:hypothetical protein n=1 Tax=Luteibacter sp. 621 TaxID=3373916 RepID=UPI003D250BEB
MASIFTGLAFMHGHIVNKELVLALGAPERKADTGKGRAATADAAAAPVARPASHPARANPATGPAVSGACC